MTNPTLEERLEEFIASYVASVAAMDFRTFGDTISWDHYAPLIANSWIERQLALIKACEEAGLESKEIAKLFPNSTEVRTNLFFDIWIAKYADVTVDDQMRIFVFYDKLLRAICIEDPYALSKNVIHTEKEVQAFAARLMPADRAIAKLLGRVVSACYHVGHALYSDMHPSIVYDNFGPYDVSSQYGAGHILAVKNFNNLRSEELWPKYADVPYMHIQIVTVYEGVHMVVDSCSHVMYDGNIVDALRHYSLHIDGKAFPIVKLDTVSATLEELAAKVFAEFQKLNLEEKKELYYTQKAYVFKHVYERLGMDWRPKEELLSEARDRPLHEPVYPDNLKGMQDAVRKMVDPRIRFQV